MFKKRWFRLMVGAALAATLVPLTWTDHEGGDWMKSLSECRTLLDQEIARLACSRARLFTVSSRDEDFPDFARIQDAVRAAGDDEAIIVLAAGDGAVYDENVAITGRRKLLIISEDAMAGRRQPTVRVQGSGGASFWISLEDEESFVALVGLVLSGRPGLRASGRILVEDCSITATDGPAIRIDEGFLCARGVAIGPGVGEGVCIGARASAWFERMIVDNPDSEGLVLGGDTWIANSSVVGASSGMVLMNRYAHVRLEDVSIRNSSACAIDNNAGATVLLSGSCDLSSSAGAREVEGRAPRRQPSRGTETTLAKGLRGWRLGYDFARVRARLEERREQRVSRSLVCWIRSRKAE